MGQDEYLIKNWREDAVLKLEDILEHISDIEDIITEKEKRIESLEIQLATLKGSK